MSMHMIMGSYTEVVQGLNDDTIPSLMRCTEGELFSHRSNVFDNPDGAMGAYG